ASDTKVIALADGDSLAYEAANLDEREATLTECPYPMGLGRLIPRDRWRFARMEGNAVVLDAKHVYCEDGFKAGYSYEVVYTTGHTLLTGAGFAATRDLISFLRYASADDDNPCAGQIDYAIGFGSSQSGRFLRTLLYLGFNEDEQQRPVLDGF